jgi:hypothetical protein
MGEIAKAMGLPDDTVFSPSVQDAMFEFHVKRTVDRHSSMSAKVNALRGQWEGFKNISNEDLAKAIGLLELT